MLPTVNLDGTVREIYQVSEQKNNPQKQFMVFDMYVFKPYWDNSKDERKTFYVKVLMSGSVNSNKWNYIQKGTRLVFSATNFSIVDYKGKQTFTLSATLNNVGILDNFSNGSNENTIQNTDRTNYSSNFEEKDSFKSSTQNVEGEDWIGNMNDTFQEDPFGNLEEEMSGEKVSMPEQSDDSYLKEVESVIGNPYS
jgi:hypothetical protein